MWLFGIRRTLRLKDWTEKLPNAGKNAVRENMYVKSTYEKCPPTTDIVLFFSINDNGEIQVFSFHDTFIHADSEMFHLFAPEYI